ncbi:nuclear transport factor 2 family protein [Amycolatopsis sp. WQ 127309]|uniref:YybH family protein n=1 Tax=Amycolatopsis sp. WQ 127309 TaxID=2932773 RepID=UPI001FF15C28|nr:nuclear transport factor 2 family protein [Amycolatopsis sp. WQ 127309]UOZ08518.1 nuclear transport factor 2 family protein [Amycolatopsis sp. WQ 127309]
MTEHDETRIRKLLAVRTDAMTSRDAETLASQYTPDVIAFTLAPPLAHRGADVIDVDARKAWFDGFEGPIEYEVRDLEITVGGAIAYCHSLTCLSTTPKGAPASFELWFRSTICFREDIGEWRITHVHDSTPFYMDATMSAALDLKP